MPAEARSCFAEAGRLNPAEPRWPYLEALTHLPADPAAAVPLLRRAVACADRSDPDNAAPRVRLAETLLAAGRADEAAAEAGRARQTDPDHAFARLLAATAARPGEESETLLKTCLEHPTTRKRANALLATARERAGDTVGAQRHERRAEELPADQPWPDPYLLEWRGPTPSRSGRFAEALARERAGQYSEAAEVLRQLTADAPDVRAWVGLGRNLLRAGDPAGAEVALRSALRIQADNAQARTHLAELYLSRGDAVAAAREARTAADAAPLDADARRLLGLALRKAGDLPAAVAALREAARLAPERPGPLRDLADALEAAGDPEAARAARAEAARLRE
jgi:predicted Zn-dependent protease